MEKYPKVSYILQHFKLLFGKQIRRVCIVRTMIETDHQVLLKNLEIILKSILHYFIYSSAILRSLRVFLQHHFQVTRFERKSCIAKY